MRRSPSVSRPVVNSRKTDGPLPPISRSESPLQRVLLVRDKKNELKNTAIIPMITSAHGVGPEA